LAYYEKHAQDYWNSTAHIDMHELYEPFLKELSPGAHILDAGCGSGRDTKAFLEKGYRVTAIDSSPEMAGLATAFTGQHCEVLTFQEMEFSEEFDGIWACASILHVPKLEIPDVTKRFIAALKIGGVFYISMKEGKGEKISEDGRLFNYYTETSFREVLGNFPTLREITFWKTKETRSREHTGPWLNFLLKRVSR
jgi:SAM-dependent methyltransferase